MARAKRRKSISRKASATVDGQSWLWGIGLGLLAAMVYWPTLDNGFIWDDDRHIERIAQIASPAGLMRIWISPGAVAQYYPLVHSTFWAEYHLWGLAPRGYHVVNLALHATSALLVWRVLVRLAVPGAWLAAAIFAVHPVCVESVAWATERKNVLSCAFALGSILAYMRFAPPDTPASPVDASSGDSGRWPFYFLALGLFITALLSKTVTASVPAVLLVIYWWKRGRVTWRDVAALVPFFAVGLALAGVTVWMETTYVGARGEEWTLSPLARLLVAGRALWFYAGKLFWPHPLCFFYPRWEIDTRAWWQYLFPASAVLVLAGLWLARHRLGRGPLAAVLIFAGVLTPALGFFNVYPFRYSFVADHFQYHASIALVALAAAGLTLAGRHFGRRNQWHLPIAGAALLMVLAITAERETHVYKDAQTLYEDVISRNPTSWEAQQNLGSVFYARGDFPHAIEHFRNAVDIRDRLARDNPTIAAYQDHLAANCANLGMALAKAGQPVEAIAAQRKGIEIREKLAGEDATRGDYRNNIAAGYVALAALAYQLKRPEEASNSIDKAIDIREQLTRDFPDSAEYRASLAATFADRGMLEEAEHRLPNAALSQDHARRIRRELVRDYPDAATHRADLAANCASLGFLLRESGNLDAAAAAYREAIKLGEGLTRDFPAITRHQEQLAASYRSLGAVEQKAGRLAAALEEHGKALEIYKRLAHDNPLVAQYKSDSAAIVIDMGLVQRELGQEEEARRSPK